MHILDQAHGTTTHFPLDQQSYPLTRDKPHSTQHTKSPFHSNTTAFLCQRSLRQIIAIRFRMKCGHPLSCTLKVTSLSSLTNAFQKLILEQTLKAK